MTQTTHPNEKARDRCGVRKLESELPSIIRDPVGEHIQKLEAKLLREVKELSQRTIEESAAAISDQLNRRIESLEEASATRTESLARLGVSFQTAERKVSAVVTQIEKTLAGAVAGFALNQPSLPPLPETGNMRTSLETTSAHAVVSDSPFMLQMPPMPMERLSFTSNGVHPQFLPPLEPRDVGEIVPMAGCCPNCASAKVRRANRKGIFEALLRFVSIAPFRCRSCRRRFYDF